MTERDDLHEAPPTEETTSHDPKSKSDALSDKRTLPVIALRDLVLFPGITLPIAAGRKQTLQSIEAAMSSEDRRFFAVLQRDNGEEVRPHALHTIGTIARIEQLQRGLGGSQLLVSGEQRGIALRVYEDDEGVLRATVGDAEELEPSDPEELAFVALHKELRARAAELGERTGLPKEMVQKVVGGVSAPGRLADLVGAYLDLSSQERQGLIETLSVEERLRSVLTLVQRQLKVLDAQEDINSQVQEELGDRQREIYLREQLKAIQKELGDDHDGAEIEDLRERVEALGLPEDALKEVERELTRLERMGREAMEAQVLRNYIETICELPWNERSDERLDLPRAEEILDEDHYGLGDVKDRVLELLAVRQMRNRDDVDLDADANEDPATEESSEGADTASSRKSPILLFAGPPGVGKTSLAKSIARAMGREYVRVALGGVRDEADIRGHRRTYVAAMPGRILQGMKQAGTKNPVFLLDEVDKLGASFQGDPSSALLEVLDPAQNDTFTDHYLGLPFDLSEVFFIATANFLQNIPQPLLDRMEVVEFSGYTESEKKQIAREYLLPRQVAEGGLRDDEIDVQDAALLRVIQGYTREAGVRQLERELGRLVRKVARRLATESSDSAADAGTDATHRVVLDEAEVGNLLGRAKIHPERAARADQVGISTGMYYTPTGGDIMFVEAQATPGKGQLTLTGQLGDVMQESARAALTYARAHSEGLQIDPSRLEDDIHLHVPAGAIPKDGPSAGVTMATAVVSALSGRPARHDLAMTGEITLSGRVLPIGGVKEKVLGAVRAGIHSIVLPKENEADLEDLPEEVREGLEVFAVEELGEVLAVALRDARFESGRLLFKGDDPDSIQPLSPSYH